MIGFHEDIFSRKGRVFRTLIAERPDAVAAFSLIWSHPARISFGHVAETLWYASVTICQKMLERRSRCF
jgi:hypothetical protein